MGFYTLRLAKKMLCGFVFQPYIGKTGSDESTAAVIACTAVLREQLDGAYACIYTKFRTFLHVSNCRVFVSVRARLQSFQIQKPVGIHFAAWLIITVSSPRDG